jgi:hypothetical protein
LRRARDSVGAIFFLATLLVSPLLLPVGCDSHDRQDLKPPPGFAPPPLRPLHNGPRGGGLGFSQGFFPVEWGSDGKTWHWMGARGEIRLPNNGRPHTLRIAGWFPLEFLAAPPTIRIMIEGALLDTFVARERTLKRTYPIGEAQLGSGPATRVVLETSATANVPGDPRALGISIEEVGWQ